MVNTTLVRRQNVLAIYQDYAKRALAHGLAAKGLEQAFAATLQISPSLWSQLKSSRPIGDKLARQIERSSKKALGWLDQPHGPPIPSIAEQRFLDLARHAWRAAKHDERKQLQTQLKSFIDALNQTAVTKK